MDELRLDADGAWAHEGTPVRHRRLSLLLHRSIARGEAGELIVTTGRDRLPIRCDDAPYRVLTVRQQDDEWTLVLSDESEEGLAPGSELLIDAAGRVRSRVKGDRFWALWSRGATQALMAAVDDEERIPLRSGSARLVQTEAPLDWSA